MAATTNIEPSRFKAGTVSNAITFTSANYGEMYMYDNSTACVIDTANVYHAVYNTFGNNDGTLAPNRDTSCFTYKAGVGYTITAFADYGGTVTGTVKVTTSSTHALLAGEPVTITGTTNYNGTYLVGGSIDNTNFYVTATWVSDDATGSVRRPATLRVLKTGIYHAEFNLGGTSVSVNDIIKFELNRNLTHLDNIGRKVEWTTNNRMSSAGGLVSITANDYIWLSVKNISGSGDVTISSCNVNLKRV